MTLFFHYFLWYNAEDHQKRRAEPPKQTWIWTLLFFYNDALATCMSFPPKGLHSIYPQLVLWADCVIFSFCFAWFSKNHQVELLSLRNCMPNLVYLSILYALCVQTYFFLLIMCSDEYLCHVFVNILLSFKLILCVLETEHRGLYTLMAWKETKISIFHNGRKGNMETFAVSS